MEENGNGLVSLRAYARHRGVSLKAVQKAIQSERIRTTEGGKIDVAAADAAWSRNTAPRVSSMKPEVAGHRSQTTRAAFEPAGEITGSRGLDYARARAVRENYLARLAKLEFEERSNLLLNRKEAEQDWSKYILGERDALLNWPARVAPFIASEVGCEERVLFAVMDREIRAFLEWRSKGPYFDSEAKLADAMAGAEGEENGASRHDSED